MRGNPGLLALALALCVPAATVTLAKKAQRKDPAKKLYAVKCAGACHRLYKPTEYSRERWMEILDDMSRRAKLTAEEAETIGTYLLQHSAAENPAEGKGVPEAEREGGAADSP